jgi:putative cell wall-binding protein
MGISTLRRVCVAATGALLLAALLALTGAMPAFAAGASAIYGPDTWEVDNTPDTAHALPYATSHTFHTPSDVDWSVISAEATGARFVIETADAAGMSVNTKIEVYRLLTGGASELLATNDDSVFWAKPWSSSLLFVAPSPGQYFIKVSAGVNGSTGIYYLYWHEGISRRLWGADRYATAAAVSRAMWPDASNQGWAVYFHQPNGPRFVVVANPGFPADVLAGASLAGRYGVPLLLTGNSTVPTSTRDEIVRLGMSQYTWQNDFKVVVMGGKNAVSDAAMIKLEELEPVGSIERITGRTRYDIAATCATWKGLKTLKAGTAPSIDADTVATPVFIVNGAATADQVVAGGMSAATGWPLLYTMASGLPTQTVGAIDDVGGWRFIVVGGPDSVSSTVYNQLVSIAGTSTAVERIQGSNRYALARAAAVWAASHAGMEGGSATLVSGTNLIDALAVGPMGGYTHGPVLLTTSAGLHADARWYLDHYGPRTRPSYVVGGTATVPEAVSQAFSLHDETRFPD